MHAKVKEANRTGWATVMVTLIAMTVLLVPTTQAAEEETGQWHALGVFVMVDKKAVTLEDRANHIVGVYELDGAVFNSGGKPFLDKARYQVVAINDIGVTRGGYKTFTDADGSKVFARYTITEGKPSESRGTFEFTGGTGKYKGIIGKGTFHNVFVSDKAAWDELVGEYRIPTPAAGAGPAGK